ncbi:zinc finger and BTB domain-containing protein 16-A [Pempheris klunzingeri]|uniref:zinc finger and BTB domain-containing protein 16-A n=1 Tax=Pempheris klunzingeri TaxID=3127111 RepID=UPI0039815ABD
MIRINNTQYFHFLQKADALRRSGSLCDAIISVKSQTFKAHRLVLACASRRLAQHLAQGDTDSPVHCTLDYFSPHTFEQVLDFTYTQTLDVSVDDLHLLLRAAQLLEMQPLEDQCRKQLDSLHSYRAREESKGREITNVKEEIESAEEMDKKQNGGPVREGKLREASLPVEKPSNSIVMENLPTSDPTKNYNHPPSPRKRHRLTSAPTTPYNRDSVITRPASSSSSFSSSWTFPNVLNSVSTLRQIAENYSNLVAAHPLQPPNRSYVAYPFSLSTPHMFPLLGPHFQNSVMSYSGFHPHYTQNIYEGSARMESIIKRNLLKGKKPSQRAFNGTVQTSAPSYHGISKTSTERVKHCQHCSASLLGDPVLQESAPTPSGEAFAGCQFCGRGGVMQRGPQSHRQEQRGEKPHQCQHCPKKFSLKHQLDTHHRVHTGEKPFECLRCGQRSRDYSAMIKHLRTHGGARPYQCTVCMEFCSSLVAMQRHVKGHPVQDFPPDWSINSTYLYTSHI